MRSASLVLVSAALAMGLFTATAQAQTTGWEGGVVVVRVPPPPPLVEVVPSSPASGFVWIDGHWRWDGAQYRWVQGYWARSPGALFVWVPTGWQWTRHG